MVVRPSVCLRRLARGRRAQVVGFGRFLANPKVTVDRIEGWSDQTAAAVRGRHVLAIQDTSEFNFRTTPKRRRGLGKIGKGVGRGVLLHGMLGLDAKNGSCLGLIGGRTWTRRGLIKIAHQKRLSTNKESHRWLATAERAKPVLAEAAMVTVVADRESDIFAEWARLPAPNFHLITRSMQDRRLVNGESLNAAAQRFAFTATRCVALPARHGKREARLAELTLRFGKVELARPGTARERDLPQSVSLTLIDVVERDPPTGTEAVHWRLLSTHEVNDAAAAWQIVDCYKMRWNSRAILAAAETSGPAPRRQPTRNRRPSHQAHRHRRQGRRRHLSTPPGARCSDLRARHDRLRRHRNRRPRQTQCRDPRPDTVAAQPAS
jgi:hypothetical protein